MAQVESRQRAGYLFGAVVLGHILLISAQVPAKSGVPMLETVVFGVFAEVQRAAAVVVSVGRHGWTEYVALRGVRAENETLRRELADAQVEVQRQRALVDRTRGLERLLAFREHLDLRTAAADVIAAGASPEFRTLTLDKGTSDGIAVDMAIMAPAGVVGRIVVASPTASKVQLLIDRNAAVGAIVERSRAQGVAVGSGDGLLRLEYVSEVADLVVGDVVVTSGIDGIYPKGFTIGRIDVVEKSGGAYKRIVIRPSVDFTSLEEVLAVLTPSPARAVESGVPVSGSAPPGSSGSSSKSATPTVGVKPGETVPKSVLTPAKSAPPEAPAGTPSKSAPPAAAPAARGTAPAPAPVAKPPDKPATPGQNPPGATAPTELPQ